MRQPEVARLPLLLLAIILVLPALGGAERLAVATAFLLEFSNDAWPTLTALTGAPAELPRPLGGHAADAFTPRTVRTPTPLVLVPGVAAHGKDDPRARRAARLLARAGFDVTLPTIPGLTRAQLRPADVAPVVAALRASPSPAVVVAVSVGSGPALLAAADAGARERVALIVTLGGYASARELVRFYLTGEYRFGALTGRRTHDPELVRTFVDANAELLDETTRALDWGQVDPGTAARVLERASPRVLGLLDALSPERVMPAVRAPLLIVHGRDDAVVPFTESVRLAAAARTGATLVLVDVLGHVGSADGGPDWGALGRLWGVAYRLVSAA